jgi:hypothetical protein
MLMAHVSVNFIMVQVPALPIVFELILIILPFVLIECELLAFASYSFELELARLTINHRILNVPLIRFDLCLAWVSHLSLLDHQDALSLFFKSFELINLSLLLGEIHLSLHLSELLSFLFGLFLLTLVRFFLLPFHLILLYLGLDF